MEASLLHLGFRVHPVIKKKVTIEAKKMNKTKSEYLRDLLTESINNKNLNSHGNR